MKILQVLHAARTYLYVHFILAVKCRFCGIMSFKQDSTYDNVTDMQDELVLSLQENLMKNRNVGGGRKNKPKPPVNRGLRGEKNNKSRTHPTLYIMA